MAPVLIAVIAVAAVALTIAWARQALAERDAVERNRRALDLLGALAERTNDNPGPLPIGEYRPRHSKAYRRPVRGGRSGRGPAAATVAVAGAVIALVVVGSVLVRRGHGGTGSRQASHLPVARAPVPASTSTTSTTVIAGPVVLVSSDNQQADYRVGGSSVEVELVPTAPCWVEIQAGLGHGPVVLARTLRPGSHQIVPISSVAGGVTVRLGNPAGMSVVVDGVKMAMPWPAGTGSQPFTLLFQAPD